MQARRQHRSIGWALVAVAGLVLATVPALVAVDLEVRMSVDNAVPMTGEPVTFTIDLRNVGADAAGDVHVRDLLPAGLGIPPGLAAFPASGSYDASTGDWSVGALAAGASSRLVIPTIVSSAEPPACLANVAEASYADDPTPQDNRAAAAVRRSADTRCVDLVAEVTSVQLGSTACGATSRFSAWTEVTNRGPDTARNVVVATLRGFRDRRLAGTSPGRAFVRSYYRLSPQPARVLARHDTLRLSARAALAPVILAIVYPIGALAVIVLALAACVAAWLASAGARRNRRRLLTSGTPPAWPSDCAS